MKTGAEIKYMRNQAKMTQEALAVRAGIRSATLSAIENGGNFTADTYRKIMYVLKSVNHD